MGAKIPRGMPFGDVLFELGLNGESGVTSFVDVRTGIGGGLGVFVCYVRSQKVFFAEGFGTGGKVSAGVCFGICVNLLVDIEMLPGTTTHLTAGKGALVPRCGRVC